MTTQIEPRAREILYIDINRFFYHNAIPFVAAIDLSIFYEMIDEAGKYEKQWLKMPTSKEIAGTFVTKETQTIARSLEELKVSWNVTRCTLMVDGWKNGRNGTLINFLVYCPTGIYFVKSIYASSISKTSAYLFKLYGLYMVMVFLGKV